MIRAILTSVRHWRSLEEWAAGLDQHFTQPSLYLQGESDVELKRLPYQRHKRDGVQNSGSLPNHRRSRLSAPMLLPHAGGLDKIKISRENSILTIYGVRGQMIWYRTIYNGFFGKQDGWVVVVVG